MTEPTGDADVVEAPASNADVVFSQNGDEYSSSGRTVVKAAFGYEYASANQSLPVITTEGVKMNKTDADAVLAEAKANQAANIVFIAEEED